ncbi:hypothetical protein N7486_007230 [Penicillium sp. IBT 16267x]|nr:hypothetical protein N7486_007230 [Penicillium sp. IBT 16267x]
MLPDDVKNAEDAIQKDSDQYCTLFSKDALGKIVKQGQEQHTILGDFHQTLQDYISSQKTIRQDDQDANCLRELYVVDPQSVAETINGRNDKLLRAAYDWILDTPEYQKFVDWSNPESCQVLWLHGPAGTGKSRLVIGIIAEISQQSFNMAPGLAYFFFQASQQNMTSPTSALRSLIWMLLIQQPHLLSYIRQTLRNAGGNYFDAPSIFWSLAEIFKKMLGDEHLSPVILALDALDECDETNASNRETRHLISLISETLNITTKVKWLLSSRPETKSYHYRKLDSNPALGAIIDLDVQSRPEPVEAYIKHKLSELERENGYPKHVLDVMSVEIRERAQNTFLWVSLVFRDIIEYKVAEYDAVERVRSIPPSLKSLYGHLMARVESLSERDQAYCKAMIAAACFACRPLSYAELHVVSGLPPPVRPVLIVLKCGSLLVVRYGIIHLPHNSTREYLNNFFASQTHGGGIDQRHADMGIHSIRAMSETPKKNIYDIQTWSEIGDISVPDNDPLAGVRYSCEFWVDHLCEGESQPLDDRMAFAFLEEHFLHWLESLSLTHKLPSALASIRKLLLGSESASPGNLKFIAFLKDATQFIGRNLSVMKDTPLQIYGFPLSLSPAKSEIKARFWKERLSLIADVAGVRDDWDSRLLALDVTEPISELVFSPDGRLFAVSASQKSFGEIRFDVMKIWDGVTGVTGVCTQEFCDLRYDPLFSIAFSPDNELLVHFGCRVQFWEVASGKCRHSFEISGRGAQFAAFSPDCSTIALACDKSIELWDIATESCKWRIDDCVLLSAMVFSPDGTILALASSDGTVKLSDSTDGTYIQVLHEFNNPRSMVFSPDGMILATVSNTVCLWDFTSGTLKQTLGGETVEEWPIKQALSSESEIDLFDIATGSFEKTIARITGHVNAVASREGVIATLKLWDPSGKLQHTLKGHTEQVSDIDFSPDGTILASVSGDGRYMLWDTTTGELRHNLNILDNEAENSQFGIHLLAFSPTGSLLIAARRDGIIKLWDPISGLCKHRLEAPFPLNCLSISQDDQVLVTNSAFRGDIWDLATMSWKTIWEHELEHIYAFRAAISPDNQFFALSDFKIIKLYDFSGTLQKSIDTEGRVRSLSFSEDGAYLKTSQGSYKMTSGVLSSTPDPETFRCLIYLDESWVMRGGQKLLRLPDGHWEMTFAIRDNRLSLGDNNGQVIVVELAEC